MWFTDKVVGFDLLCELVGDMGVVQEAMGTVISALAMEDVPMSDAVIKLGIVLGVLMPNYRNGWSKTRDN